jgi:hypothetical protein
MFSRGRKTNWELDHGDADETTVLSIRPVITMWRFVHKVYKIKFYAEGGKLEEWEALAVLCEGVHVS